jgi:hypothetical protein
MDAMQLKYIKMYDVNCRHQMFADLQDNGILKSITMYDVSCTHQMFSFRI